MNTKPKKGLGAWFVQAITTDDVAPPSEAELINTLLTGEAPPLTVNADAEIPPSTDDAQTSPAPQQQLLPAPRDENSDDSDERGVEIDKSARIEMVKKFFGDLYRASFDLFYATYLWVRRKTDGGYVNRTLSFWLHYPDDRAKMAKRAIELNDEGWDIYFGVHLSEKFFSEKERASENDIKAQCAVIVDIDIESPWHVSSTKKTYPPDFETAKSLLPFEPSILVNSGGGLHAYYEIITENGTLVRFDDDEERQAAVARNKKFVECIKQRAGKYAGAVDSVFDLPRVFRVPGCYNLKNGREGAPLCGVVSYGGRVYPTYEFDKLVENHMLQPPQTSFSADSEKKESPLGIIDAILRFFEGAGAAAPEQAQSKNVGDSDVAQGSKNDTGFAPDPPELVLDKVRACLKLLNPADFGYEEWLPLMSGCKGAGLPYVEFDAFAQRDDPKRYTPVDNKRSWDSSHGDFNEKVVIEIAARRAKFDPVAFTQRWYLEHSGYRRLEGECRRGGAPARAEFSSGVEADDALRRKIFDEIRGKSDKANAERLAALIRDKVRYLAPSDRWLVYDNGIWAPQPKGKNSTILPVVFAAADKVHQLAQTDDEKKLAKPFENMRSITPILTALKGVKNRPLVSDIVVSYEDLDREPELLAFANCIVDLGTGKVYQHSPETLITRQCRALYRPDLHDTRFSDELAKILPDDETREAFLRYIGFCATGYTKAEKFLVENGGGRNGKGSINATLLWFFGSYATTIPIEALLKGKPVDPNAATPVLNLLEGRRVAVSHEAPKNAKFNLSALKTLTGGDPFFVRPLHEEGHVVETPTHSFILCSNDDIEVDDANDKGFKERLLIVRFTQEFIGERCNPNLKAELRRPEALSGLADVIVAAAYRYLREGLIQSADMKKAAAEYLERQDWLADFVATYCERDGESYITLSDFTAKLKSSFDEATRFSRPTLINMIRKLDGIRYEERRYYSDTKKQETRIFGLRWLD